MTALHAAGAMATMITERKVRGVWRSRLVRDDPLTGRAGMVGEQQRH